MVDSVNIAPSFTSNPINKPAAVAGQSYSSSIASDAIDPNPGDTLTFSKLSGPAWLNVAGNGALSGTPLSADAGTNSFVVRVTDSGNLFVNAALNITVAPAPPILAAISVEGDHLVLSWSGGMAPTRCRGTRIYRERTGKTSAGRSARIGSRSLRATPRNFIASSRSELNFFFSRLLMRPRSDSITPIPSRTFVQDGHDRLSGVMLRAVKRNHSSSGRIH